MALRIEDIYEVLASLVDDLRHDFIETQQNSLITLRRNVFHYYYAVESISRYADKIPVAFVDAGFKPYQLDVSIIIPIQIGAVIRDEDGKLHRVKKLLDKPVHDFLLLYSGRRRSGDKYSFTIKIKTFHDNSLLFDTRQEAEEATKRINALLSSVGRLNDSKGPKFFAKLTKYIEGLLELAYALKLLMMLEERGSIVPSYAVLDGTLIKWFGIRRRPTSIDGLDILSAILDMEADEIKKYLFRIVGLSKTSKFTNIIRSQSLFHAKKPRHLSGRGLYSLIDLKGIHEAGRILEDRLKEEAIKKFVEEIIKIFNRIVYNNYGVYVARFPLTTDYRNVFMLDIYLDQPVMNIKDEKIIINNNIISSINSYVSYIVNTMLQYRTRIISEPPFGYMEVDNIVRLRDDTRKFIEQALIRVLRTQDDLTSRILEQVFSSTTRMRYGYR